MRHAAQACTTSDDLKAAPRRINRRQRPQPLMTPFPECTCMMGPPTALRISRTPASATSIDRESVFQKTSDLDRPSRGVGWMRLLGRNRGLCVRRAAKRDYERAIPLRGA